IVVDMSSDKTKEIALKYTPNVFSYHQSGTEARSAQKNYGLLQKSTGKFLLSLDADMNIDNGVVKECVSKMTQDMQLVGLYIPEIISGDGWWSKVRRFERTFYNGTVIDGLRFFTKEAFLKVGGFDENLYACEDWDLDKRLKQLGKFGIISLQLYHNEAEFNLKKYLSKKAYYSNNFEKYFSKWGKSDLDVKKQFGLYYRYFGVFIENGKWKKLLSHPILTLGMYFLRGLVGIVYLTSGDYK
ncbi:MAG: glycosyltransferase, partial [Patescibacteria group bacterium]|nr:glycosyltransferase [Patescibacteria group bacterium]